MGKLLKLREWLSVEEAARHLSSLLEEPVSKADVYRLSLEGHLTLSIYLMSGARAHLGRVMPFKDLPRVTPTCEGVEGAAYAAGLQLDKSKPITDNALFVGFDDSVGWIDGVWDLAMMGAERDDIERRFQELTGGPAVDVIDLEGPIVMRPDGQWAKLLEWQPAQLHPPTPAQVAPASRLPHDAALVLRASNVAQFQIRLAEEPARPASPSAQTRERESLLKLIMGMALEAYRYDPDAARSSTAAEIASDLAKHGLEVTDDTVRKYLREAAATVLPRRPTG